VWKALPGVGSAVCTILEVVGGAGKWVGLAAGEAPDGLRGSSGAGGAAKVLGVWLRSGHLQGFLRPSQRRVTRPFGSGLVTVGGVLPFP